MGLSKSHIVKILLDNWGCGSPCPKLRVENYKNIWLNLRLSPAEFTHPMYGGAKYGGINMWEGISQPKLGTKCMNVHHEKNVFFSEQTDTR